MYNGDGWGHVNKACAVNKAVAAWWMVARLAGWSGNHLWSEAIQLGGQWNWSDWFGYFSDPGTSWIYHNEHQWIYCVGQDTTSIWFWMPTLNWLWTDKNIYPNFYRSNDSAWLWYHEGTSSLRWFYNSNTTSWETH